MDEPLVETHALRRDFGPNRAVDALDLTVARGEVVGLLGHNGAGKTTTVRLLAGVLTPTAGRARVFGLDPATDGVAVRRRIGVSTETPAVDDRLTGRQGLRAFADLHGVPRERVVARVAELLEDFDLAEAADRRVGTYSKGMRQRLALARALLHEPTLLFLDEPTAGLDPVAAHGVAERVRRMRAEGRGVVLCTHDLVQAQALCDRVVVLEHGKVVAEGAPSDLAADLGAGTRVGVDATLAGGVDALVAALAAVAGWRDVAPVEGAPPTSGGAQVAAVVQDAEAVADGVAALVAAGARVHGVERDRPSLQDVYFALHERGA
ncbi:MAG: ABC transporter ATP-binding protein, partial [Trueperaceae bacterium]|nr:ABC transporter ATP-binding protein [Trueperaceae bacterium]